MRLDKFLKISRLIKRRTLAKEACDNGKVTINEKLGKASDKVEVGDILSINFANREIKVKVISSGLDLVNPKPEDLYERLN
ncbi:RNA-binding S4 domain-containing protein [Neofamilia massiliensis]|uniref:RNA-binding S4 domain-containing protein n=1 Tax=Neofamilia massiliensis TaxID=1673724 RepID=UPI0006BB7476|nr:RNA-binding S4 domain-containing protein [Neofamilia massiliensis]